MALVPMSYPLRSLAVRWRSSLFSAVGIACTVAVFCGIMSLRAGFNSIYEDIGSDDVMVYMRPGATSEGESALRLEQERIYKNERPEVARNAAGAPMASSESYLALYLPRYDGGTTNVPLRGVEPMSFEIHGDEIRILEGRKPSPGADEVIVGKPITTRILNTNLGDTLTINTTPFKVVGIFEHDGAYGSEIWGDVDRFCAALDRSLKQRVIAKLVPGADVDAITEELEDDKRAASKAMTEKTYLDGQRTALGGFLQGLAIFLSFVMGIAAILSATNTMLASVGSRSREVGILLSLGFGKFPIFFAFFIESILIGLVGGILGSLMVLPFDGIETGTMNMQTFTEVLFAFRVTPGLLFWGTFLATLLGAIGGVVPSILAATKPPTEALRRT